MEIQTFSHNFKNLEFLYDYKQVSNFDTIYL